MPSSLKDVRTAVCQVITDNLAGVSAYKRVPKEVIVPCVIVAPIVPNDFLETMNRGGDMWPLNLRVLVPSADSDVGQDALDDFVTGVGDRSLKELFFNNRTLGLSDAASVLRRMTAYGFNFQVGESEYLGADLRLEVLVTNR